MFYLFQSFPLILTILFAYFTLIPEWLHMPPFLSSGMLRYKTPLGIIGAILFLSTLHDLNSGLSVSLAIQNNLASLGLPMSGFVVSNLTYFITIALGVLSFGIRRSRQRVKVELQWYMKLLHSFKHVAYLPPRKMIKKGFPILVQNGSDNTLIITNIRLITIIGYPLLVPYSVIKAFLKQDKFPYHAVNVDKDLDMPKKIEARKAEIFYIPWNAIEEVTKELSQKVDFSKTAAMSFISLYDEFSGKKWDTRVFHVLTALFVRKAHDFVEAG